MLRICLLSALIVAACARDPAPRGLDAAPPPSASALQVNDASPREGEPWPELPESAEAAEKVLSEHRHRRASGEPELTFESVEASLGRSAQAIELTAGVEPIAALLSARAKRAVDEGRPSFVLLGTFHDAPAQIALFRKLVGPLGYGPSDAVVEQFHAVGRWRNVAPGEQAGDSAELEKFQRDGTRSALDGVIATQRDHDYTAWKYDYLEELPALAATLRASGVALHGCDLPSELQARARNVGDAALSGLRELHCVLSLEDRLRGRSTPATVAMLWGARHAAADGAARFLPKDADVVQVQVFGGRPAGDGLEAKLATRVRFTEPVLFPVDGKDRFALILPEGPLGARVDRVRTQAESGDPSRLGKLELTSEREVELWVGERSVRVGPKAVQVTLGPGQHGFLALAREGVSIAGGIPMPEHGFVELGLDPRVGSVRLVVHRGR